MVYLENQSPVFELNMPGAMLSLVLGGSGEPSKPTYNPYTMPVT